MGRTRKSLIIVAVTGVLIACGSFVPRQGWYEGYGPVVPHDSFPADCSMCHEGGSWSKIKADFEFDHEAETGVALNGAHAGAACLMCHNDRGPVGSFAAKGCAGCHEDAHRGRLGPNCDDCHNEDTWRPIAAITLHARTRFPLVGPHAAAECFVCHEGAQVGNFEGLTPDCAVCHADDLARATEPDHAANGWTMDCQRCHIPLDWKPARFDHPATFPLVGGHAGQGCNECHTGGTFTGLSTDCAACHLDDFTATTDPNHSAAGFNTDCAQCHTIFNFGTGNFQHTAVFPLTGGHNTSRCSDCHAGNVFAGTPTDCASCHLDDFNATGNPDHNAAGFDTDCTRCHDTDAWGNGQFNHTATFPLTQGHATNQCTLCHTGGVFAGTPTDCASCHLDTYNATMAPDHAAAGFPTTCQDCHTTAGWGDGDFIHTASFPLTNSHAGHSCATCHVNNNFTGLSPDCASCHQAEYDATTDPNHNAAGFPTDCVLCHTTTVWGGAGFVHAASFPLSGGHAAPNCSDCHVGGVYTGTPTDCASCHLGTFNATTNPNHVAAGFPTDCSQCHTINAFGNGSFQHTATFPLTGAHNTAQCNACHSGNVFAGTPTDCASCHLTEFNATSNPSHAQAGFGTDCQNCHVPSVWANSTYTHPASFPLTSAHAAPSCNDCHGGGTYAGTPTDCASCHLDDYNATTAPDHTAAGFPTDCTQCHTPTVWGDGVFDHTPTFPLSGGHNTNQCSLCHSGGVFAGTPTDCASCHLSDYNATTNPNHSNSGFPTDCVQCHDTGSWLGATFNHPRVNRGNHSNLDCIDCHVVLSATPAYECILCHEHNQSSMASRHSGRSGYQWVSTVCYDCHYN